MSIKDEPHRVIAIDIHAGISPFVRIYTQQQVDFEAVREMLQTKLNRVVSDVVAMLNGEHEIGLGKEGITVSLNPGTDTELLTSKDRLSKFWDNFRSISEECSNEYEAAEKKREEAIANHPDNGKLGYWRVEGTRHTAIVKADSAQAAIDKAIEIVQQWEDPDASFIGEEIDVLAV